jgi:paraquat-inducible protein B
MKSVMTTLIIWSIAFAAITVSASLTYSWYSNRGPEIKISFKNTAGLIPHQSKIMYRGAEIGRVTGMYFDLGSEHVIVYARLNRQPAQLIGKDSRFWIVQPEFSIEKISNLHAIATGDYIAVQPIAGPMAINFVGDEMEPMEARLSDGLQIKLRSYALAGIEADSPLLYHGQQIGEVWETTLTKDRREALVIAYVYKEYADLIRKSTIFSNISGFHADIHLFGGTKIGMDSLRTIFRGGINVSTTNFDSVRAKNNDVFRLLSAEEYLERQDS